VTAFVAMLRAVNVAGTGKLPMADLRMLGTECGFTSVRTFIASGKLLFESPRDEAEVASTLERRIERLMGKHVPLFVRSASEMAEVVARNPFADDKPSRVMAHFIAEQPTEAMLESASGVQGEWMALGPRAIYVSYGEGIGKTKLKLPAVAQGTARNMNSVAKIAALLA
jgi:uncharacterized protein (DUF1697 family)